MLWRGAARLLGGRIAEDSFRKPLLLLDDLSGRIFVGGGIVLGQAEDLQWSKHRIAQDKGRRLVRGVFCVVQNQM